MSAVHGLPRDVMSPVGWLITTMAAGAGIALAASAPAAFEAVSADTVAAGTFLLVTLFLQVLAVPVYGRGSISVAGIGILAAGFMLGPAAAMAFACLTAMLQWVRRRGLLHRAIFDAADLTVAGGAAASVFALATLAGDSTPLRVAASVLASGVFYVLNIGPISLAMALSEGLRPLAVWRERFRWLTGHYLAFGPLALAAAASYEHVGVAGVLAFVLPPALMIVSVRQYLDRTAASVEDARRANEELRRANAELTARNDDLRELFELAGGLAARTPERDGLLAFAEDAVGRLAGSRVRVTPGEAGGEGLFAGGVRVGSLELLDAPREAPRWSRLRDAVLPQLATAIETSELLEQVRQTHLATIAALSAAIEAKDDYTGGHTERVARIASALGRRLGFGGADLDALHVGALLHDIGKIGIPEHILHKPGRLDEAEWETMKQHPVISDRILAETDLPPIVREIARSSHERMDGTGYPDALAGDEIPFAARIVLVADAWDALTSDRPYRRARGLEQALAEVREHAGTQFCPRVVEALERLHREEPAVLAPGPRLARVA